MILTRAVFPSLFTILNAFCGFLSILNTTAGQFDAAVGFIVLAAIFDSLDGVMARITRSSSQFGVELDSLADVVSFGAAPSILVYQAHLHSLGNIGILISSLPLVFGAIRLARFNVQLIGFDKEYFRGLPIPLQALTICAFFFQFYKPGYGFESWTRDALAPLVVGLALLMVSTVRYDTLPKLSKRGVRAHPWRVALFSIAVILIIVSQGQYALAFIVSYILFGVVRSMVETVHQVVTGVRKEENNPREVSSIDI
jgi:CDP-diacylglycerol--serine O-phosphatidyltransferase